MGKLGVGISSPVDDLTNSVVCYGDVIDNAADARNTTDLIEHQLFLFFVSNLPRIQQSP